MTQTEVDAADPVVPDTKRRLPRGFPFFAIIAVAVLALIGGGLGGSYQGKLSEVQKNDNSSYLPASAKSPKPVTAAAQFNRSPLIPGFLVFHRDAGLTTADRAAVAAVYAQLPGMKGIDTQAVTAPTFASDN